MERVETIILSVLLVLVVVAVFMPTGNENPAITGNVVHDVEPEENFLGVIPLTGELEQCTVKDPTNMKCTRDYRPVCGADGITYPNACTACQNKAPFWQVGTCESIVVATN